MSTARPGAFRRFAPKYARALAGSLYAFTVGWTVRRHRGLIHRISQHFGGPGDEPAGRLPEVAIEAVAPEAGPIVLPELSAELGNVTTTELAVLARLARKPGVVAAFEFGTFDGRTALALAANLPAGRVVTLDLPAALAGATAYALHPDEVAFARKPAPGARLQGRPEAGRVTQLLGDSATFDFSPWRGQFDLVFVDASHVADYVRRDAATALTLLRPGGPGLLVFHDYGVWPDVTTVLDELQAGDPAFAGLCRLAGTSLAVRRAGH